MKCKFYLKYVKYNASFNSFQLLWNSEYNLIWRLFSRWYKNYILKRNHLSYITLSERIVLRHLFTADGTETLFLRLRKRKNQVNTYYHIEIRRGKEAQEFKESKNTI